MRAPFTTLLESSPARGRRTPSGLAVSVALHGAAIALAVVATAGPGRSSQPKPDDAHHFVWVPPAPTPSPARSRGAVSGPGASAAPRTDERPTPRPLPQRIDFDPSTLPPIEAPLGRSIGERWETPAGVPNSPAANGGPGVGSPVLSGRQVDVEVALLRGATPRYPSALRDAGAEGRVTLRFVVDTTGRVEPASVQVVGSTDDRFTAAARATLPALRFSPATAGGRRVRQLVELPFEFRMTR